MADEYVQKIRKTNKIKNNNLKPYDLCILKIMDEECYKSRIKLLQILIWEKKFNE